MDTPKITEPAKEKKPRKPRAKIIYSISKDGKPCIVDKSKRFHHRAILVVAPEGMPGTIIGIGSKSGAPARAQTMIDRTEEFIAEMSGRGTVFEKTHAMAEACAPGLFTIEKRKEV